MQVTVNVECTPEEARTFLGLPDVKPMQAALLKDLEDQLRSNITAMSPESMMKTWLPMSSVQGPSGRPGADGANGIEGMQKMFWNQMQQAMSGVMTTASTAMSSTKD